METNNKYIYPNILVCNSSVGFKIQTTLRKQHKGKYYLCDLIFQYNVNHYDKTKAINNFHKEVYSAIISGEISPELTDVNGEKLFIEDPNQEPELERIKQILNSYGNK